MLVPANQAEVLEVLKGVRARSRQCLSVQLPDRDALALALACSSVESEALVEYGYEGGVRREALGARAHLALSDHDFGTLFGSRVGEPPPGSTSIGAAKLAAYEMRQEAKGTRAGLEAALSTTLQEATQKAHWKGSSVVRVASQIALIRNEDAAGCLSAVVGGTVATDARRIDDLKSNTEDAGIDVMVISEALYALAASVV